LAAKRKSVVLSLIRCGETTWDNDGRLHGRGDLPLSIAGRAAVEADVASLSEGRRSTVCHPPDEAATETAQIIARTVGAKVKSMTELAEPDLGVLEGLSEQAFAERFPKRFKQWQDDPLSLSPPEGEELVDARARVLAAAARLLRRARNGGVSLVLHPLGLGFLRCWLADRPPTDLWAVLRDRPRIEQYLLGAEMIDWLDEAAKMQYAHA
jgi:broad specificity phosphatase PhoE